MTGSKCSGHDKDLIKERMPSILDILQSIANGDFSKKLIIPEKEDGFTELYSCINQMIDDLGHQFSKKVEENENANHLSTAMKISSEAFLITNLKSEIVDVNDVTLELMGIRNRDDLIGKDARDFIVPKDHVNANMDLQEVLDKGYVKNREYFAVSQEGREIPVDFSLSLANDENGYPKELITIMRKTSEHNMEEQKYRELMETSLDMIFKLDLDGNFLFTNKSWKNRLGYTDEEVKKINGFDIIHPDDVEIALEQFKKIIEGHSVENLEFRSKTNDGSFINVLVNGSPILDSLSNVVAILGVGKDITDLKKFQEEIKNSEEKYKMLFENVNEGILHLDMNGTIADANPKLLEILDCELEEMVQMNVIDLLPAFKVDINQVKPALENTLSGELSKIEEWKITNKKGQELILSARPALMKRGDEIIGISVVLDDITERKKAEEVLMEKTAKLERFAKLSVGREKKMIELKERIKNLEAGGSDNAPRR